MLLKSLPVVEFVLTFSPIISSDIPSSFASLFCFSVSAFLSFTFEATNSLTLKSGFSAFLIAISFSIASISASLYPASFNSCFCEASNLKSTFSLFSTSSVFSSNFSSFCEVASVSSVAVFSFVVASLVASVAVFSAALLTTSLACSLSSLFSLITFSVVTASDCAVAVASTLLVFVVLAIELSADTWFANIIGLANTPKANKILAMLFLFFLSIKSSLNGTLSINIF